VLAGPLGWDAASQASEIHQAREVLERLHRVQIHSLVA
jgi:glycerol-3-phosphate dehydrogenase